MENNTLIDILSLRRAHDSEGEAQFIKTYLLPLDPVAMVNEANEPIAYYVTVKPKTDNNLKSNILWSCHIDTMHKEQAGVSKPIYQTVHVTGDGLAFVTDKDDCLGADDGAGAWLMLEMIKAGVRGTYVFHRGEERGCWGSRQVAKLHTDWLKQFTHAIAFDRRGTTSIITHQKSERCCSDALGQQLIGLFNMKHELDPTGIYTDTAEYTEIIPECLNISSGYQSEHSNRETLDMPYLMALCSSITKLDWDNIDLVVERDPSVIEYDNGYDYGYGSVYGNSYGGSYMGYGGNATIPSDIKDILNMDYRALDKYVRKARTDDLVWLLMDMADVIREQQYDLEFYSGQYADDDDDEFDDKLKVGMQ